MSDKPRPPKKGLEEPEAAYLDEAEEAAPSDAEIAALDAWMERNKDAINASIEKAHQEYLRGECRPLDEVMAEIRARAAERIRKKASPTSHQVVLSSEARKDLDEIEAYIVEQSGEGRAAAVMTRLQKAMHKPRIHARHGTPEILCRSRYALVSRPVLDDFLYAP